MGYRRFLFGYGLLDPGPADRAHGDEFSESHSFHRHIGQGEGKKKIGDKGDAKFFHAMQCHTLWKSD
jgi:hypothetical protein